MTKILTLAINDLRVFFADRGSYVLFVMPVIMALVLGMAMGGGYTEGALPVDVIDLDNSTESQRFLAALREVNASIFFCPQDDGIQNRDCRLDLNNDGEITLEKSRERMDRYMTNGLIVIPQGYGESLRSFSPIAIDYYSDHSPTGGNAVYQALQTAVQRINAAVVAARVGDAVVDAIAINGQAPLFTSDASQTAFVGSVYQAAERLWANDAVRVRYTTSEGVEERTAQGPSGFTQSVPGMGTMFVLFTVLTGMVMLINERKYWTLQRIVMMPVSRAQILAGKVLSRFLLGVITFTLLIIVGIFVGLDYGPNLPGVALIVIVYTLCVTALAFAIAPLLRTEMQVSAVTNLFGIVLAAIGGAWWPLEIVPDFMRMVARISPVSWAMSSFNELIFYGGGLADIAVNLGVLLVAAVVLFGVGIMNFRYE